MKFNIIFLALALTMSSLAQTVTNFTVIPEGQVGNETYTLQLPANTEGTLTLNGVWTSEASVTRNAGQNSISANIEVSTTYTVNNNFSTNLSYDFVFNGVTSTTNSGLVTENWYYTLPITHDNLSDVIITMSSLSERISGGNFSTEIDTMNVVNGSYSYEPVPEPTTLALAALGLVVGVMASRKHKQL